MIRILHTPSGTFVHSVHPTKKCLVRTPADFIDRAIGFETVEKAEK